MSKEGKSRAEFDYQSVVKEEYEFELYGFPLKDLPKENFTFVKNEINTQVESFDNHFMSLLKDDHPELRKKIITLGKQFSKEVVASVQEDIKKINDLIVHKLGIPDNVLLLNDLSHSQTLRAVDEMQLKNTCETLRAVFEDNALFLSALEREVEQLEQLNQTTQEGSLISKAEELLYSSFNLELQQFTVKKIQDISKS